MTGPRRSARPLLSSEERAARIAALARRLDRAVADLTDGEQWRQLLQVASRFHSYSFRNLLLLHSQAHERGMTLTQVAGYTTWKQVGRAVRKGERGLAILAPVTRRAHDTPPAQPSAEAIPEGAARAMVGVRIVHVFDLSQTDGPPLPQPPRPAWLRGPSVPGLWDGLARLVTEHGHTLHRHPYRADEVQGFTDHRARTVSIRADLTGAQASAVLCHELGHIRAGHAHRLIGRPQKETEAESIAHIVLGALGLDSTASAVPYVAGWSGGDPAVITAAARTVHRAATTILTDLQRTGGPLAGPAVDLTPARIAARASAAPPSAAPQRRATPAPSR